MACCTKAGLARSAQLSKLARMKATKKANDRVASGVKPKKAAPKKATAKKAAAKRAKPCTHCVKK